LGLWIAQSLTGDIDPVTGKMYINDVGKYIWEEINLGVAGANYGWPECEGKRCENSHPDLILQRGLLVSETDDNRDESQKGTHF
jgi:glucose/arabinose dehydrogenase